ncbi:MAG: hypothetical protein AAF350_07050 [Pseudomonadota bacterium]
MTESTSEAKLSRRLYDLAHAYWSFAALSLVQFGLLISLAVLLLANDSGVVSKTTVGFLWATMIILAAFVWIATPVATFRLATAVGSRQPVAWTLGGFVPVLSLIALFVLPARAQAQFAQAEVHYRFFGQKLPFHADWSRPHLVSLAAVFAVLAMLSGYAVTTALAADGAPSPLVVQMASLASRTVLPAIVVAVLLFLSYGQALTATQSLRLAVYAHANAILVLVYRLWQRQDFINTYGSAEVLEQVIQLELRYLVSSIPVTAVIVWLVRRVGVTRRVAA